MRSPEQDMKMVEAAEELGAELRHGIESVERNPYIAETNGAKLIKTKIFRDMEMTAALRYWIEKAGHREEGLRRIATRYAPSDPDGMAAMMIKEATAYLES